MRDGRQRKTLGLISITMIPLSVVGTALFSTVFISAPVGIVCGVLAIRRGQKVLGLTGAICNALVLIGLLSLYALVATSKTD